jgi:hypothetical protein
VSHESVVAIRRGRALALVVGPAGSAADDKTQPVQCEGCQAPDGKDVKDFARR